MSQIKDCRNFKCKKTGKVMYEKKQFPCPDCQFHLFQQKISQYRNPLRAQIKHELRPMVKVHERNGLTVWFDKWDNTFVTESLQRVRGEAPSREESEEIREVTRRFIDEQGY